LVLAADIVAGEVARVKKLRRKEMMGDVEESLETCCEWWVGRERCGVVVQGKERKGKVTFR